MDNNIIRLIHNNSLMLFDDNIQHKYLYNKLYGGGKRILTIEYKEHKYEFIESKIDDNFFILYSQDKNEYDCVTVLISTKENSAEIIGISGLEKKCIKAVNNDVNEKIGSTLLIITIKMLKKYKNKLNINKIFLKDNSLKKCNKVNIKLSHMLILLTGDTWYGKYGFRPYNRQNIKLNKLYNENYEKNKKIIKKITIENVNIIKYIKKTKNEKLIKSVEKLLNLNPKMLLKDFLSNLLQKSKYDEFCNYFYSFYEELYNDIGLTDFYQKSFVLYLEEEINILHLFH